MKRSRRKERSKTSRQTPRRRSELLVLAKSLKIKNRHRMTIPQLIQAIGPYLKKTPTIPIQAKTAPSLKESPGTSKRSRYDDLSWSYGKTELVLMPVDPFLIYAYWDFSPKDWEKVRLLQRPVVLRAYDVTMIQFDGTNAHHYFDVPVSLEAQNWYVHLWSAEKSLCADLGWLLPDGSFHLIVRSNIIQTPRAGVSIFEESRWVEVQPVTRRVTRPAHQRIHDSQKRSRQPLAFWKRLEQQAADLTTGEITGLSSQRIPAMTQPKTLI